jgi:Arc/MetJ-type ribon-helix-helix transcriptional regulator
MKMSVSIPEQDVQFLDEYARRQGLRSRSAALHQAVRALRAQHLEDSYAAAWAELDDAETAVWDTVTSDGLDDVATR